MAQWVKNLPAVQETQEKRVWSLGQEDRLEEEMVTHFSTQKSHGQRSLAGYSPQGCKESEATKHTHALSEQIQSSLSTENKLHAL